MASGDWSSRAELLANQALRMQAALPEHPVDASEVASQRWQFPEAQDIAQANALRVRWRSEAVANLAAHLHLQDHLGSLWVAPGLMPFLGGEREAIMPLKGFQPSWYTAHFDLITSQIRGLGISIPAANGPGTVSFELLSVEAIQVAEWPALDTAPRQVRIHVDPQVIQETQGQRSIHPALFGVHGVGHVAEEQQAEVAGLAIGSVRTIEHTRFPPKTASPIESAELRHLVAATGSQMSEAIHAYTYGLFDPPPWEDGLSEILQTLREFGESVGRYGYHPERHPEGVQWIEFWNEPFLWGRHINLPYGKVQDPQQHGHYSGPLAARKYAAMYNAFVEAARAENPYLRFAGPSSSSFASDNWRQLTDFVLPIVAEAHPHLDAIAEHHYQGRGRQFAAEWLVADAAIQAVAGRSIPIWNTECNDLSDTPGGWGGSDDRPLRAAERKRAAYQLDEILSHLNFIPHLARGRAIHMLHNGRMLNRGEAAALRFLRYLRGDLLVSSSSDERVLIVAASNEGAVEVVVYNDRGVPVQLDWGDMDLRPQERLSWDSSQGIRVEAVAEADDGRILPALSALRLRLADPPVPQRVLHRQLRPAFRADGSQQILQDLAPGEEISLHFQDPPSGAANALWLVSQGLHPGQAWLRLPDGEKLPLPTDISGPLMIRTLDLPQHSTEQELVIVADPDGIGFRLCAVFGVWHSLEEKE